MEYYVSNTQMQSPRLSGVSWTETRLHDHLPPTPVLSFVRLTFRPDVNIVNETKIGHSLWQQSLALISTIPGFQRVYWASISDDPNGVVVLIQWQSGDAWKEFQFSFGFGLMLPLLQQKPLLNCCVQLNLPADFAAGPGHILELVELSVLRASNKYDPAERCQWVNEEWQGLIEVLKSGVLGITFPKLLCGVQGWLEDDIPSEYRTFFGLLLWKVPCGRASWIQIPALNKKILILTSHSAGISTILTDRLFEYNPLTMPTNQLVSVERFSGTIFVTQISPPQYSRDKGFDYIARWDLWGKRSVDEAASGRRICPLPRAFWCPMGAMSKHGFPTVGDVLPRSAVVPMIDVLWLYVDESYSGFSATLGNLCRAIHNKLGSPRLRWGREASKITPEPRTSMFAILIGKLVNSEVLLLAAHIDQLVDAAVIQGRGVIQRRGPELDRYCASLSMNQPSQLELLSISVPNDECHKDILWHAYHRFKWTMSSPAVQEGIYVRQLPTAAAEPLRHGFHEIVSSPLHSSSANTIRFSASTAWLSAEAREEWYTGFADQAISCYERLGYIIAWFQTVALAAECFVIDLEPIGRTFDDW
ncbi:hypothetical protein AnigIFM50267_009144 [Aspergillus niger]|nr:hypothetical protein AnigIFM50267_009144 [Aspergillus niger]GLA20548.1 hypothetical protein AnigIFM62618_009123 [Aspergillus niger]